MTSERQKHRLPNITEAMTITNPLAAGIDVGSTFHAVSIPPHLTDESSRIFGSTTPDLIEMVTWLQEYGITTVVLESTGNYWVHPVRIIEDAGIQAILVHPAYARQAKRTKYSDLDDSVWLQLMHSYGLLPSSFLPPPEIISLRRLWRHRDRLIIEQGRYLQKMQDSLDLMNVQLHRAITDISGVTGMSILRSIVAGERDPKQLALYRDRRVKSSYEDMVKALTGDYREGEIFILKQQLARYDFTIDQLTELDEQIENLLVKLVDSCSPPCFSESDRVEQSLTGIEISADQTPTAKPNVAPEGSPRKKQSKQEPSNYNWYAHILKLCGVDATRICGMSVLLVLSIISELGVDLSPWASAKQFTAWLGLAPDHKVTGGKVIKRQTRRGKPHAAHFFYLAALAVTKSHTPLGEFYRYQKARMGPRKALNATARKIAIKYYHLLKYGPAFMEEGQRREEVKSEGRKRRRLDRLAAEMGLQVIDPKLAA